MVGSRNSHLRRCRRLQQLCTLVLLLRKVVVMLSNRLHLALPASAARTGYAAAGVGPSLDSAFGSARSQLERSAAVFAT